MKRAHASTQAVHHHGNRFDGRFGLAVLAGCLGLGFLPAGTTYAAGEDRVSPGDIPREARAALERDTRGAREVQYYKTETGTYVAHFTLPNGLRLETRVRRDGSGAVVTPTRNQPDLSKREAERAFDQYVAARKGAPEPRLSEVERARLEADRAKAEAARARDEADRARREALGSREAVERQRAALLRREEEAREDRARRLEERDSADFYGGRTYRAVEIDTAPFEVRRTLRDLSRNGSNVDYYAFRKRGDFYYAVQYTTPGGRRVEVLTNEDGRVIDRVELADWELPSRDIRDRDNAWDRDRGWDRDRDRISRYWIPGEARTALDDLIAGGHEVDFYRIRLDGRTLYAARYTDFRGRRVEARVTSRGDVVETVRLYEPAVSRDRDREFGRD
jgi:hypothetical protein